MSLLDSLLNVLPLKKKAESAEYYFAIHIDPQQVIAAIWGIEGNILRLVSSTTNEYEIGEGVRTDEGLTSLIKAANIALDEALADFQPEPTKLLFGVPEEWLENEALRPEYLKVLKRMVKALDVVPMAYVSTVHAVSHYLQKQTGVPTNAVLVDLTDPLSVSVVKGGKILGTKQHKRSENVAADIEKVLMTFDDVEVLPSKILLFGGEDAVNQKQDLASHTWMAQLPFLHLPKIDVLEKDIQIKAVCFAGGSELVPELAPHIIDNRDGGINSLKIGHRLNVEPDEASVPAKPGNKELAALGFSEEESDKSSDVEELSADDENLDDSEEEEVVSSQPESEDEEYAIEEDDGEQEVLPMRQRRGAMMHQTTPQDENATRALPASGVLTAIGPLVNRVKSLALPGGEGMSVFGVLKNKLVVIPLLILILFIGGWIFFDKATVTIALNTKSVEKESQVTVDPNITQADESNNIIPGTFIQAEVTDSLSASATGQKQIGDPAKGQVVIYNATTKALTLAKGTSLTTSSGIKYTLDTSVQVASKSASAAAPPTESQPISATAVAIGPDGNIPAATELAVSNFAKTDVVAKVDTAFSGGISKNVVAVTADDQTKLFNTLDAQLKQKGIDQLNSKLPANMKMLQDSLTENVAKKTYSANVGDQASQVTLTLVNDYKVTGYSTGDLNNIVSKLVADSVPAGYKLDLNKTQTHADFQKVGSNGKLVFDAKFTAQMVPNIDLEQVKQSITGKGIADAENILTNLGTIQTAQISLSPSLPGPFSRVPFRSSNISIKVLNK